MTEEIEKPYQIEAIPEAIQRVIGREVELDIAGEDEPEGREYLEQVMGDYRISSYHFLKWLKDNFDPNLVLYAGSGQDVLPKEVLGQDRVVHTSLENYPAKDYKPETQSFPALGEGKKVITDNRQLPFSDSRFDSALLLDMDIETIPQQIPEIIRVLQSRGTLTLSRSFLTNERFISGVDDEDKAREKWEEIIGKIHQQCEDVVVPQELQKRGESESEFFVFRKV